MNFIRVKNYGPACCHVSIQPATTPIHHAGNKFVHPVVWIKEHICSFGLDCSHGLQPTTPFTRNSFGICISSLCCFAWRNSKRYGTSWFSSSSSREQRSLYTLWCSYSPACSRASQPTTAPICLKTVWDMTMYFPTDAHLSFWQTQNHRASQLLALKWGYFLVLHLDEWSVSWNGGRNSTEWGFKMFSTISYLESCILPSHTLNCMIQRKTFSCCLRSWVQPRAHKNGWLE